MLGSKDKTCWWCFFDDGVEDGRLTAVRRPSSNAVAAFGTWAKLDRVHDPMHRWLPDGILHSKSSYRGTYDTVYLYLQVDC